MADTTTTTEAQPPEEPFDVPLATLVGIGGDELAQRHLGVTGRRQRLRRQRRRYEITIHDPENGEVLDRLGPDQGVNGPDDVYVADDGTIYSPTSSWAMSEWFTER